MGAVYAEVMLDWIRPVDALKHRERLAMLAHRGHQVATKIQAGVAISSVSTDHPEDLAMDGQPWLDQDQLLYFDGSLSNHKQLATALGLPSHARRAMVILTLWRRYREAIREHLPAGFVLIVIDLKKRSVLALRDAMGMRVLHYKADARGLALASEPAILRQDSNQNSDLQETAIAQYFAFQSPGGFFAGVQCLAAGESLLWQDGKLSISAAKPALVPLQRDITPTEAITEYQRLLAGAIERQLANDMPIGFSLSGGLDSNILFASAAATRGHAQVQALSWQILAVPDCDESALAMAHARGIGANADVINVDDAYPLSAASLRRVSLNTPVSNIYREIKTKLYRFAQQLGVRTLVNGHFGDHGYYDSAEWAAGTLGAGAYREFFNEMGFRLWRSPWLHRDPSLRRLARRALLLSTTIAQTAPELTPYAINLLQQLPENENHPFGQGPRARQHEIVYGDYAQFEASGEAEFADGYGIQTVAPFRDAQLMRFMLSLPNHLGERRGVKKWLAREAMRTRMPENLRTRIKSTSLQPFLDWALRGPARQGFLQLLDSPEANWSRYYNAAMIRSYIDKPVRSDRESAVIWLCLGNELWRRALQLRR